jgi:hypothetical protein
VYPFGEAVMPSGSVARSSQGKATSGVSNDAWQPFVMNLDVPRNARFVNVGFWSEGLGTVEVRNLAVSRASARAANGLNASQAAPR